MQGLGDLGISLLILGAGLAAIGYLVLDSVPVLVLGISIMVMGVLAAWGEGSLERTQLDLSRAGWDNVAMILEGLGTASRAIYLPSNLTEFKVPMALVPLVKPTPPSIKLPRGFSIRYGRDGETGVLLYTPGSIAVNRCMGAGALGGDLDSSLVNCVVNHLAISRSIAVAPSMGGFTIDVRGPRVRDIYGDTLVRSVLGSPMASIVASIAAESLGLPVIIEDEEVRGSSIVIRLRVISHGA